MALDLGGNKKKPNDKSKYSIVELSLFKPGKKKYSEFDYEEIRKKQLKEDDSSGDDERFHDREALEIVKRLEAKYGGKKTKKGRKLCFGTEDDYMDKRAGYDLEDDFIDDSEAYDELIPSTMDTVQGGFYVNRGKLEFKTKHEEVNDSDISDGDESQPQKKGTKRPQISSDDDVEVIEDPAVSPTTSANVAKTVTEPPPIPIAPKPRMVGAPPTKVRRMTLGESPNQRAANAIKKRLVGMPPTLLKRKVLQTAYV
ncbi:ubinuclein-2, partial [Trichostrongylus colubriformis]